MAAVFFESGMIEAWRRGFDKIREEACAKYDAAPENLKLTIFSYSLNGYYRQSAVHKISCLSVYEFKLLISVGMPFSQLHCLLVELFAVIKFFH